MSVRPAGGAVAPLDHRITGGTVLVFVAMSCMAFDVPIRQIAGGAGAVLRDLVMLVACAACLLERGAWMRGAGTKIVLLCALCVHVAVGLYVMGFDRLGLLQTGFGLLILLQFMGGLCLGGELYGGRRPMAYIFWFILLVSSCAVLLDSMGGLASLKTGLAPALGGVERLGYGKAYAGAGLIRLSGFARMYSAAALIIGSTLLLVVGSPQGLIWRLLIIPIAGYAMWLTNAKTTIVVVALLLILQLYGGHGVIRIYKLMIIALLPIDILLPVVASGQYYHLPTSNGSMLYSLIDRMSSTWPAAWRWFDATGLGPLGRGIGGVGAPQFAFATASFNPGDSLFVMMYGYFGLVAVLYMGLLFYVVLRVPTEADVSVRQAMAIVALVLFQGLTSADFEEPFTFFLFGGAISYLYCRTVLRTHVARPVAAIG